MTKKISRYDGQWLGRMVTDDGEAWIALELEHLIGGNRLAGVAYFYPDRDDIASGAVEIKMDIGATHFEEKGLHVQGVDPRDGALFPPSEVASFFPDSGIAEFADVSFDLHPDGRATVSIHTEFLTGDATLVNSQADPESKLKARKMSWDEFRAEMFKDGCSERPHFSIMKSLNIGNPRAVPQQAVAALTNVDDIEAFFDTIHALTGKTYLYAFDIPVSDRKAAMDDLLIMGIQAGALMPGLDGSCRALRYRHFGD